MSGATASPQESLAQRQATYDEANRDRAAILHLITGKPAALLVTKYAKGAQGTRGNGLLAAKELESQYVKTTDETARATQEYISTTRLTPGQDPGPHSCTNKLM